jgi:uncharacterized protein
MATIHPPSSFRRMPWKNGGGATTELWCEPSGAALDAFDLRLSVAEIDRDGPFSAFAGVDRTLILLDGPGMVLRFPDGRSRPVTPDDPEILFAGEDAPDCMLLAGPTRDFNLMVRRGLRASAELRPIDGLLDLTPARGRSPCTS